VQDRGDQSLDVAVVEAGSSVTEIDGDAAGEAGRQHQDAPFASGAGNFSGLKGGDRSVPVDGGHRGGVIADAGAGCNEAAGEVTAEERALSGEQRDAGFK
jgi:hypothetical protein